MPNAVLVVDMLVGFLEPGHNLYCGDDARKIIPNVKRLIESEQKKGSKVFFIADNHDPDDLEFKVFRPHCIRGTKEAQVIPELAGYKGELIPKKRYSAFYGTDLEQRLAKLKPDKLIIVGVCTDICVMYTASSARNRDYAIEVPVDCVASFDQEAHRNALKHMSKILGVKLLAGTKAGGR